MEARPSSVVMYGCLLSWLSSPSHFQCLKDSYEHFKSKYWLPQPWTLVSNCVWPQPVWLPSPVTLNLITKKQGRRASFWERQQQHIPGSPGCRAGGNRSPATCFSVSLRPCSWLPLCDCPCPKSASLDFLSLLSPSKQFPCLLKLTQFGFSCLQSRILTGTIRSPGYLKHESNLFGVFLINGKIKHQE